MVTLLDEDGELVTFEPGDRVLGAHGRHQTPSDLAQQLVAGVVPEAVVDVLEPVEIEVDDGGHQTGADVAAQCLLHPIAEQRPVRQAGQTVMEPLVGEFLLDEVAIGDVVDVDDDAADVRVREHVHHAARDPYVAALAVTHPQLRREDPAR